MAKENVQNSVQLYKRLISYGLAYWPAFVLAIIGSIFYSGIDASFTYMLKPLLDKGFVARDANFLSWLPIIIPTLFICRAIANFLSSYFMSAVGRSVVMHFRQDMFNHLLQLPSKYFDQSTSGQLLSRIIYNTTRVADACTDSLTIVAQSTCLLIGLLIVMLTVSWQLTLIFLGTIPPIALAVRISGKRLRKLNLSTQNAVEDMTHVAEEAIEGYRVVKMFGGQTFEESRFHKVTKAVRSRDLKVVVTKTLSVSAVQFFGVMALTGMILMATVLSEHTALTAGEFAAVMTAMMAMLKPLKNLTSVNSKIQKGLAGAQSIFELLDQPVEANTGTKTLRRAEGNIQFKNVNFSYGEASVLKNINLNIEPGQVVALVGHSGGGKSTLVSLLSRFYEINSGEISIDGVPVSELELVNLRSQIAWVSQHITLFNDTVRHNIAYGQFEKISDESVDAAARSAHAMEFIESMPDGMDTLIGENGVLLSGGQRQRIAIARAILKDAPILILDEATSALDTASERHIQAALDTVMKDRTTLVIAHRLTTIESADKIVVLDKGEIKEVGQHDTLLAKQGYYARLHAMQFSDTVSTEG